MTKNITVLRLWIATVPQSMAHLTSPLTTFRNDLRNLWQAQGMGKYTVS